MDIVDTLGILFKAHNVHITKSLDKGKIGENNWNPITPHL